MCCLLDLERVQKGTSENLVADPNPLSLNDCLFECTAEYPILLPFMIPPHNEETWSLFSLPRSGLVPYLLPFLLVWLQSFQLIFRGVLSFRKTSSKHLHACLARVFVLCRCWLHPHTSAVACIHTHAMPSASQGITCAYIYAQGEEGKGYLERETDKPCVVFPMSSRSDHGWFF